jgi:predicted Zn-dependent peptidase
MSPLSHTLANGVTVICDPVPGFETLALSVVAGRGARCEDSGRSGWSHLLEHMVFKGAGERSAREIVEPIEGAGGQINAATGHERTSFQVRALAGGLPLATAVTADLVRRPHLAEADLDKEKQVVLQEIAEAADTPDDQVFELAHAAAFAGQALGRPILGAPAAIGAANGETLEAWRAALYGPGSLVISAAGAVEEAEFLRLAESAFGDAPGSPIAPTSESARFTGGHGREVRALEQAHVVFLLPAVGVTDADYWPVRLVAEMLGGGMSSRLFQEARERLGLAYAIDAWADAWADIGLIGVYAGCAAADASRLAQVAAEQIRALATGAGHDELARAKAQLKASLFMGRESLAARAEQAAAQHLAFGRVLPPMEMAAAIDRPGIRDIARVIADVLSPGLAATAVLGPKPAMAAGERFAEVLFA